jgi:radical SAM protein with 4Fe4S-binding SPASM domain
MDPVSTSCDANVFKERDFSSTEIWQRLLSKTPYPLAAVIEVTSRCNLRCPHCYLAPARADDELSTAELLGLLDQMADMGVLILTITGGEPTIRSDFFEILCGAVDRRFVVVLKTNAAGFTADDARKMAECGLHELNASLYHTSFEKHDRFVGRAGAWNRTVAAMRAFKEAGRNVRASITVMNWNLDAALDLEQMCVDEGWRYTIDFRIEPRNDGGLEPTRYRATPNQLVEIVCRSAFLKRRLEDRSASAPVPDAAMCGVDTGLVIKPDGAVVSCVSIAGLVWGKVRDKRLADIWRDSTGRRKALRLRWGDSPLCASCGLISDCHRCPATGFIEHGNFTTPSALDCELAEVWREARLRLQRDDG